MIALKTKGVRKLYETTMHHPLRQEKNMGHLSG